MVECDAGADPIANAGCLVENFTEIALNDPGATPLLLVGVLLIVVPSVVFGGIAAGGILKAIADLV